MNAASFAVAAIVVAAAAFAAWRCLKKGAPCECGGSRRARACRRCAKRKGN